jgi:RNA polymerase sigma factor (sigma-70 family)
MGACVAVREQGGVTPEPHRTLARATDERLAAEVRNGNEAAFEIVYRRYRRELLAMCRHMLGSASDAEDAVQQALASAWAHLRRERSAAPECLKPWLFKVARNHCLTMLRTSRIKAIELDASDAMNSQRAASTQAEAERRAELRAVLNDMADLPIEQRHALVLSELHGLSHAEIAAVLGRREEHIKTLVFRARLTLADWRDGRETSCADIRELLSRPGGGAMRRRDLGRHLELCGSCRAFGELVRATRKPDRVSDGPSSGWRSGSASARFGPASAPRRTTGPSRPISALPA